MNDQTLNALKELAAKLGTTAEHLWAVLIRQAYVSFATDLVLYALGFVALYGMYKGLLFAMKLEDKQNIEAPGNDRAFYVVIMVILIIVGLFVIGAMILHIPELITKIANPEYWALMQVLEAIGGAKTK